MTRPAVCDTVHVTAPTVLIVDDHPTFRQFARRLLGAAGYREVAEASDGASALATVATLRPQWVLLDVLLPDVDGFEVAERLAAVGDPPRVVLTSSRTASDFGERVERSSACGFISKGDITPERIIELFGSG